MLFFSQFPHIKKTARIYLAVLKFFLPISAIYLQIYKYYIKEIYEEDKTGYINVDKEKENQLILTTCHPDKSNKQLVINAIKKEF